MPDSLPPSALSVILAAVALAGSVVLGLVSMRLSRRLASLRRDLEACRQDVSLLRGAVLALVEEDHGEERQAALETRLRRLARQQEQLMLRDAETGHYLQAVRQAERGASVEELMAGNDLTRGEAELILRLHGSAGHSSG